MEYDYHNHFVVQLRRYALEETSMYHARALREAANRIEDLEAQLAHLGRRIETRNIRNELSSQKPPLRCG